VGIVTGAGAGIGRATALGFAREGAAVVVADRDPQGGRETLRQLERSGAQALFVEVDVSRAEQVEALVAATLERFGALHCASNNAAAGAGFHPLVELDEARWERAVAVTLKGVWLCMKHQIPALLASGGGSIVNIGSVSGMRGEALQCAYAAAKGGVLALSKTAAAEYAQRGVRVNVVAPGGVRTDAMEHYLSQVPGAREHTERTHAMRRLGEPEEIADAVIWLCGGVLVNPHTL
jgi:NAD(P)-dependent dehydrogenase (short-subunit alcohol dehydrogenase family)